MSELPTRALSLYAPWAWAIICAGKDVENRNWFAAGRGFFGDAKFRGSFWIHASLFGGDRGRKLEDLEDEISSMLDMARDAGCDSGTPAEVLQWCLGARGKIVGSARVTGAVSASSSPWFVGPMALTLAEPVASRLQVPVRGALGFWTVSPDVLAQLREVA